MLWNICFDCDIAFLRGRLTFKCQTKSLYFRADDDDEEEEEDDDDDDGEDEPKPGKML